MADQYVLDTSKANNRQGQRKVNTVKQVASAPATVAKATTHYSGKGVLTAELLAGFVLVLIRVVADFEIQDDGTTKGNVGHPSGQYGPLPILAGLIATFFVLSLVSIGGGTRAKVAVILGATIILTLGVKSITEIEKISSTFGNIGTIKVGAASGSEGSGASSGNDSSAAQTPAQKKAAAANPDTPADNAIGAFNRLEQSPVTGVGSAVKHAVGGTWDLITGLIDAINSGDDPIAVGVKKVTDFIKGLF